MSIKTKKQTIDYINRFQTKSVILWSFYLSNNDGGFFGFDSFPDAYSFSQKSPKQCLCENTTYYHKIKPFFDIEWNADQDPNLNVNHLIYLLQNQLTSILGSVDIQLFVKSANGPYTQRSSNSSYYRQSYHLILTIYTQDQQILCFRNKDEIKKFYLNVLNIHPYFDMEAYKGFNLRLLNQDKFDKGTRKFHNRILLKDTHLSTINNDLASFLGWFEHDNTIFFDTYIQQNFVLNIVKELDYSKQYSMSQFKTSNLENDVRLSLELTEQKCPKRQHHSNNSSAMLFIPNQYFQHILNIQTSKNTKLRSEDNKSFPATCTIKCLDGECDASTTFHLDFHQFSIVSKKQTFKNCGNQDTSSQDSQTSSQTAVGYPADKQHLQDTIYKTGKDIFIKTGSVAKQCQNIGPNGFSMMCELAPILDNSNLYEFSSQDSEICQNNFNSHTFPVDIGVLNALKLLKQQYSMDELKQLNIHIGDVNYNNCTFNNINNNNNNLSDEIVDDIQHDFLFIQSENERKYVRLLMKQRMQYITYLYNELKPNDFIYVIDEKKDQNIYYFTNFIDNKQTNGGLWTNVAGLKYLKKRIRNELEIYFDNIVKNIPKKQLALFNRIVKQIINTIDKQGQMDQYAMETFEDNSIKFNQNKHLLHFTNGTYDLDERVFVKTTQYMLNTQMINYEYNQKQQYDFIEYVIQQIVGQNEYPWFIKQLSNCLHPDSVIEAKQIIVLTGQGNNGKTLVFNLMNNTLDTSAYAVNGRSIMIQASNEQMSSATPDLMLLKDKRFCYFAELDYKKPFNQQQIKQLSGGDMIQGRNLYDKFEEFEPHAGLFVSCNKIPNIDTNDGGFLNRIKILELKNQFVDEPQHQFHIQKDKKLLNKIKTKKWRQGFMNLLIEYYYKNEIKEPQNVQQQIQQKIDLNLDPLDIWADEHIQYKKDSYLIPEQVREIYNDNTHSHIQQTKYMSKLLDQYFKKYPSKYSDVIFIKKRVQEEHQVYGKQPHVFVNVELIQQQQQQQQIHLLDNDSDIDQQN